MDEEEEQRNNLIPPPRLHIFSRIQQSLKLRLFLIKISEMVDCTGRLYSLL
jgi:hypothetical protein